MRAACARPPKTEPIVGPPSPDPLPKGEGHEFPNTFSMCVSCCRPYEINSRPCGGQKEISTSRTPTAGASGGMSLQFGAKLIGCRQRDAAGRLRRDSSSARENSSTFVTPMNPAETWKLVHSKNGPVSRCRERSRAAVQAHADDAIIPHKLPPQLRRSTAAFPSDRTWCETHRQRPAERGRRRQLAKSTANGPDRRAGRCRRATPLPRRMRPETAVVAAGGNLPMRVGLARLSGPRRY